MCFSHYSAIDIFDFRLAASQHVAQHGWLVLPMMCESDVLQALDARQIKFDAPGACDFSYFFCDKFGQGTACRKVAELADPISRYGAQRVYCGVECNLFPYCALNLWIGFAVEPGRRYGFSQALDGGGAAAICGPDAKIAT